MKTQALFWLVSMVPLLSSCVHQPVARPVALAPVGPGPFAWGASSPTKGDLKVYSATERYSEGGVPYRPHTDYSIYTSDGRRLKRVRNHRDREDESPTRVTLPPGDYVVRAKTQSYGSVRVVVVIKPNQLTTVMLQPAWKPKAWWVPTMMVTLPDGCFVGWRADWPEAGELPLETRR